LEGRFAEWAATLLPFDLPIALVTDPGKEEEAIIRLTRVGFEQIIGYLNGGIDAWQADGKTMDMIIDIEADELMMDIPHDPKLLVVDVRKDNEFETAHLENAFNLPLQEMTNIVELAQFEEDQQLYIHCAGGYRSVIAASLFKRQGVHNLRNVLGGWSAIKEQKEAKIVKETKAVV
jgi:rhodanese-related sulfurtransferase